MYLCKIKHLFVCVCMLCDYIPAQGHTRGQITDDRGHTLEGSKVIQANRKLYKINGTSVLSIE